MKFFENLSSRNLLDWAYASWDAGEDAPHVVVKELHDRGWDDLGWLAEAR